MSRTNAAYAPMIATLHDGHRTIRAQLQQMDEREVIDWAFLELLQQSTSEFGYQAEALLAIMTLHGAEDTEMLTAQELVLFFAHTSVLMMMQLWQPKQEDGDSCVRITSS